MEIVNKEKPYEWEKISAVPIGQEFKVANLVGLGVCLKLDSLNKKRARFVPLKSGIVQTCSHNELVRRVNCKLVVSE